MTTESEHIRHHIRHHDRLRARIEREHRADAVWTTVSVVAVVVTAGVFIWMCGSWR